MAANSLTRKEMRKRRRRQRNILRMALIILVALLLLAGIVFLLVLLASNGTKNPSRKETLPEVITTEEGETIPTFTEEGETAETESGSSYAAVLASAKRTAAMYDYDGAVNKIKTEIPDYQDHTDLISFISECEAKKGQLVKWADNTKITHVFFHTLIMDNEVAFNKSKVGTHADQYNQVMTTISEFNEIMQQMYDRGYVLVRLTDIASFDETTGQMKYNEIWLPEGKIPFVLSEDDVSYYEYMNITGGYAQRLVVTEDGKVMNEVDNPDGTRTVGAYDVLPLLDEFIEAHPDFSYHGAKGIIALTGYNGILGYRTSYIMYGNDEVYAQHYDELFKNGEFDEAHAYELAKNEHAKEMNPQQNECEHIELTPAEIENERAKAKKVAEAILADGWEFASHTWGHMDMSTVVDQATGTITNERLQRDTRWWSVEVEPLLGDIDVIIFAKGADIGTWRGYAEDNAAFQFLKRSGFNYFCNVDSSQYFVQMSPTAGGTGYFRQGRRNLDGFLLFKQMVYPDKDIVKDLMDVYTVFDFSRPLPVMGVTLPEGFTGITMPDGSTVPIAAE